MTSTAIAGLISSIIGGFFVLLAEAWCLMMAVMIAHEHWIRALPTIGFWWACLIILLLKGIGEGREAAKR